MKKKFFILFLACTVLMGCEMSREFKQKDVVEIFESFQMEYDSIINTKSEMVNKFIIFNFYFSEETPLEEAANIIDEVIFALSNEEILLAIRKYYYETYDTEYFSSTYPSLEMNYYFGEEIKSSNYYINDKATLYDSDSKPKIGYHGWEKRSGNQTELRRDKELDY